MSASELDAGLSLERGVSRRELLKGAAAGAGTLALSGGLTSFLAGCGGGQTTSSGTAIGPNTTGTLTVWHYS